MSRLCWALLLALPLQATAADQAILGKSLAVTSPPAGGSGYRKLVARAVEPRSPQTIVGDPTAPVTSGAALLHIRLEGATPSEATFTLAPGLARDGAPFWRTTKPAGFEYTDRFYEQGPVRRLRLRKETNGTIRLVLKLKAIASTLALAPPNPGTQGWVLLQLGSGDRYCVRFGPDALVRNRGERAMRVTRVASEGCPALVSGDFLALTYNVAGLPQGISGSDPEINTPLIAPLLNGYDLVLMQETWKTPDPNPLAPLRVYHEILEAGSLHPFKSVPAPLPIGTDPRRPSALVSDGLNRFSRFPFDDVLRTPWNDCHNSAADCLSLKGFSVARTTFAPGVTVDVYNLHMEAGGDPEDDALRDAGVTQLSIFMQDFSAGRPVIVGGDFNLHTDAEPDSSQFQRLLAETGLADVCATLACPEPGRIDKFLFRSAGGVTLAPLSWHFETEVFVRDGDVPLSDHDALAVRFGWER